MVSSVSISTHPIHQRLRSLASVGAFVTILVSVADLFGWALRIPVLTAVFPGFVTMKPITAICFSACATSLLFLSPEQSLTDLRRRAAQALALIPTVIGIGTLIEFIIDRDLHFEEHLFRPALRASGLQHPGQMAFISAVAFVLLGLSLFLLDLRTRDAIHSAQILAFCVLLVGGLHTLAYFYAADDLDSTFRHNPMALHTAVLFAILGLAVISARPHLGFAAVFNDPGLAGRMARRVIPTAIFFTVVIGRVRLLGERLHLYTTGFGLALFATATIAMLCVVMGLAARSLSLSAGRLDLAARNLANTNDRLAAIVESSEDAIISRALDGTITSWNAGAQRIFGYTADEAIAKSIHFLIPPDRHAEETAMIEGISKGRPIAHFESVRVRKDGSRILVSVSVSPLRDSSGAVVGASKIVRDITEQRRTQLAALQNEARLTAIIGSAMDAVITVDEQHQITIFNPAAEKMFGCPATQALGTALDRFIPQRFRADHAQNVRVFGQTNISRRQMGRIGSIYGLRSTGEEFPIEASISHADVDGRKFFTVILRDVTERHRAEDELRQQARLLDLAPVLVRDLSSRVILWTHGAQKLYGYSSKEAVGRVSHELLQTEFPGPIADIEAALYRDGSWDGELIHKARDGHRIVVASNWVLHFDAQGKPTRILEINADLTDLKRAQTSQMRSQKLESLGTLAGGVAHDFNNILLAINGNTSIAAQDLPADHPVQRNLSEVAKAGARAADLVRRILAFSRPHEQKREPQSVQPIVEEALRLVRATLPATTQIETSFQSGLPAVALDATQIHQVIVNLATNASHAIGDRTGTISVRLSYRDVNADDCSGNSDLRVGPYVVLTVTDDGCGMDRATLERIFDPFFTTKPVGQGTGLGLSVVHGIISSYGGAITAYSEPGKGTSFALYFPALDSPASETPSAAVPTPAMSRSHEHILYVDDEEGLVALGTILLQRLGYQVTGYIDACAALDDFRARPDFFAAVVTDLSMPRISGFDLARQFLAIRPDLPILMTSGFVRPEDQKAAEDLGIRRIILKPSTLDQLAEALADSIQSQSTTTTAP